MRGVHEQIMRQPWEADGWAQLDSRKVRHSGGVHRAAMTLINEGLVQVYVGRLQNGIVYGDSSGATYYRINPAVREAIHLLTPPRSSSGAEEAIFKACVQILINAGIHPSGTVINNALGRDLSTQRNLSGREGRWREEVLEQNGWVYDPAGRPRWRAA